MPLLSPLNHFDERTTKVDTVTEELLTIRGQIEAARAEKGEYPTEFAIEALFDQLQQLMIYVLDLEAIAVDDMLENPMVEEILTDKVREIMVDEDLVGPAVTDALVEAGWYEPEDVAVAGAPF